MSKLNIYQSFNNPKYKRFVSCIMAVELVASGFAFTSCKKNVKNNTAVESTTAANVGDANISLKNANELGVELPNLPVDSQEEVVSYASNSFTNGSTVAVNNSTGEKIIITETNEYQIVDKNGEVIGVGKLDSNGFPAGFVQIPGSNDMIPTGYEVVTEDQTGKNGEVVFEKGDVVREGTIDKLKNEEPTTRIVVEEVTSSPAQIIEELVRQGVPEDVAREIVLGKSSEPTTVKQESKPEPTTAKESESTTAVPKYKQYGFTSEEDYNRWLAGEEYVLYNGVMVPYTPEFDEAETIESDYQKTLN